MAYNEVLADRIKNALERKGVRYEEKRMFGGLCFLVDEKMLMGVEKNRLMARIDPDETEIVLKKKGVKPMDFTGRVMKGYVFVDDDAVDLDTDLEYWLELTLDYNPKAKSSKNKSSKNKSSKLKQPPMNSNQVDPMDPMAPAMPDFSISIFFFLVWGTLAEYLLPEGGPLPIDMIITARLNQAGSG